MILITGATGFVGTALIEDLAAHGLPFRAVSRHQRSGHFAIGDISAETDWSAALVGVTGIVHLAARVHVMSDDASDPLAAYRAANVDASLNLARQAAAAGVRRLVFVSSIKVNGEVTQPGFPFTEDMPAAPVDPYGQSKLEAERALFELGRSTGMEIVVVRPPLVYGPGVKANFASMIDWMNKGIPLPLGAVRNSRSMIYVHNLTNLLIQCLLRPEADQQVFLASDGIDVSTTELLTKVAAALKRPARLVPIPEHVLLLAARITGRQAIAQRLLSSLQISNKKAEKLLDWSAPVSMDDGLENTVFSVVNKRL